MKRIVSLVLVLCLSFVLMACNKSGQPSSTNTPTEGQTVATATATTVSGPKFDSNTVAGQMAVEEAYLNSEYSHYYVAVITNNSSFTVDIDGSVTFFDEGNNLIGSGTDSVMALPAGQKAVLKYYNEDPFARAEHQFSVKQTESSYYTGVIQDLVIENQNIAGDKVVFSVRNNGTLQPESVYVNVLFYQGGTLVDLDSAYLNEGMLGPGQSTTGEASSWDTPFDSVQLYITGYARK